ncbi:DUF4255 domain-containing protein [Vicingaceae bacterium]|nr:DUF4255 domain-containing protein [Vicingaceae bacterium]
MISSAVGSIVDELNEFIKTRFRLDEDRVILSNLVNADGSSAIKEDNKIVVSIVNIQEERLATPQGHGAISIGSKQPIYLNLFLLFSTHFNEKLNQESLRFISAVIGFFQSRRVFTPGDTPSLDASIEKLVMEIYNLDFKDQSSIYSTLGAKYTPSIIYKMRMVAIDEGLMDYSAGLITERDANSSLE